MVNEKELIDFGNFMNKYLFLEIKDEYISRIAKTYLKNKT